MCRACRSLANLSSLLARWTVVTPMSSNRSAAGVTVFEGRIYVSGGHDGLQIFNSVSRGVLQVPASRGQRLISSR